MGWGANSYLRISKETSYGVINPTVDAGSATEGTDYIWVRLDANNRFTPRVKPVQYQIRSADSGNRPVQLGSNFATLQGNLTTPFYPSRAGWWLDAFLKLTSNDLTSYTFDFFDSVRARRYPGFKGDSLQIQASAQAQNIHLNMQWTGQANIPSDPTLAAPAITNFPSEQPYLHQDSVGVVKIANSVITKYSDLTIQVNNKLYACRDELPYITSLYYAGRDVSWGAKLQYAANTYRPLLEGTTVMATNQWKLVKGGNSVTIDLKSTNYLTDVEDDLPIDGAAYQTLKIMPLYDRSATTDFSYTVV